MNVYGLERTNYERVLKWAQFFEKESRLEDSEPIFVNDIDEHYIHDIDVNFEEAEEVAAENLQDEANVSNASCNNTIASINKFIALNPSLPLVPICMKAGNGNYDIDSEDDDIQKLLNETIPIVIEHKRRLKEAGMDRILDTFDANKIEKEVGEWLRRNQNSDNSLNEKISNSKYTKPCHYSNDFTRQKFNGSYESDEESMHSVDTARYILSNQKRNFNKQKFGSMCTTTTTTIKTFCLLKSKRDALNKKYKTYPEHYEAHIKDILDRRCLSQVRTKRSDSKTYGISAESHNIKKRRKHLRKRVIDHSNSVYSSTDSSDEDIHEKYFKYRELKKSKRISNARRGRPKRNFNCCTYRCRCGRQCNVSTTSSSFLSSHSFENKQRRRSQQNLELDLRPCKLESECDCVNEEKLCSAIRHLADTSTERWLVDNNDSPLKNVQKIKKSQQINNINRSLSFESSKQSLTCEMEQNFNVNNGQKDIENSYVTSDNQHKTPNRLFNRDYVPSSTLKDSVKKIRPKQLEINYHLLKSKTTKQLCLSDSNEDCEMNQQNIVTKTSNTNSDSVSSKEESVMDDKYSTKQMLDRQEVCNLKNIATKNISSNCELLNEHCEDNDLEKRKSKLKKEKITNNPRTDSHSIDIKKKRDNAHKVAKKQVQEKQQPLNLKNNATKKVSNNYKLLNEDDVKKDLEKKKYESKEENAETHSESDNIKRVPNRENKNKKSITEKQKSKNIQVMSSKKDEPLKKQKKLTRRAVQKVVKSIECEFDNSELDSNLQLAIVLSQEQFEKENNERTSVRLKEKETQNCNDASDIENNDGIQPKKPMQKSVAIPTKSVSSTLTDDTFFENCSIVCNSTALVNNIATNRQIPTYLKTKSNKQTLDSSKSDSDCTIVTSTTNDLQNSQHSSDLDIGQQTKKGILIYTPTKKTSAPAHSFSNGCFNITQDHLSKVIGERSASKFLKYYLGPRRFDANATVYYKPPMSPIMDEDTDSSADDLECIGLFGDLHVSLSSNTEKT